MTSKLLFLGLSALAATAQSNSVPDALHPPASQKLLLELHAVGDQIYTCEKASDSFVWTLKAPDAHLFDAHHQPAARHFAGPTWQASDGSTIAAKPVAKSPSPSGAIPWLLLQTTSRQGNGVFTPVTFIQRLNTQGGTAPSTGCDEAHSRQERRVPYQADYLFYTESPIP